MVATVGSIEVTLKLLGAEKYAADFGRSAAATEQAAGRMSKATASAVKGSEGLGRSLDSLNQGGGALRSLTLGALRAETSIGALTKGFTALGVAVGGIGGGLAISVVTRYADAYTNIQNKIAAVVADSKDRVNIENELFGIAQRSRSSLDSTVALYQRLNLAAGNLGATQKDIFKVVETTQKAFVVGGSTVAEAASTATQLAQALGSGKLSGDEFRAISENAPILFQAIAKEFGVGTGELKQMASDGLLTADRVFKAIIKANAEVEEAFSRTTPTIAAGLQQIDNALTRYIGQADKSVGASKILAESLKFVADNIRTIGDSVLGLVAILAAGGLFRAIGSIASRIKAPFVEASRTAEEELAKARTLVGSAQVDRAAASAAHDRQLTATKEFIARPTSQQIDPELEKRRQTQLAELERINKDAAKLTAERTKLAQQLGAVEQSTAGASMAAVNRVEASKARLVATETKLVDLVKKQGALDQAAAAAGTGVLRSQQQNYYNALTRTVDARNAITALNAEITQAKANIAQLTAARATAMDTGTLRDQQKLSTALFAEQKRLQELDKDRFARGRELNAAMKDEASAEAKILSTQSTQREKAAIAAAKNANEISKAESKAASTRADIAKQDITIQNQAITQAQTTANKRIQIEQQVVQNEINQQRVKQQQTQVRGGLAETAAAVPIVAGVNQALEAEKLNETKKRLIDTTNKLAEAEETHASRMRATTVASRGLEGVARGIGGLYSGLIGVLGGTLNAALLAVTAGTVAYSIVQARAAEDAKTHADALEGLAGRIKEVNAEMARGGTRSMADIIGDRAALENAQKGVADLNTTFANLVNSINTANVGSAFNEFGRGFSDLEEIGLKAGVNIEQILTKIRTLPAGSKPSEDAIKQLISAIESLSSAGVNLSPQIAEMLRAAQAALAAGAAFRQARSDLAGGIAAMNADARDAQIIAQKERDKALSSERQGLADAGARNKQERSQEADIDTKFYADKTAKVGAFIKAKEDAEVKGDKLATARLKRQREFAGVATDAEIEALARKDIEGKGGGGKAKKSQGEKDAETLAKKLKELDEEARASGLSALDEKVVKFAQSAKVATTDINQFIEAVTNDDLTKVPATMQAIKDGLEKIDAAKFGRKALDDLFPAEKLAHDLHLLDVAAAESPKIAANLQLLKFGEIAKNASEFSKSAANAIGDFVESAITDFKSFGDALDKLAKSLEKAVLQATLIKPLEQTISGLLGGALGGGTDTNWIAGLLKGFMGGGAAPSIKAGPVHSGGLIGYDPLSTRQISLAAFNGAQRFHSGFTAKEFPAILEYGERVLTAKQQNRTMSTMNGLAGAMGSQNTFAPQINIINNSDAKITTKTRGGANGPSLDVVIDQMMADKLATPGSASNRAAKTFLGSRQLLTSR